MQTCFRRNVHKRSLEDIQASSAALEPPPMAAVRLDCAALLADTDAPGATPTTPKRKASSDFSDAVPSSFPRLDDAAAPSSPKRAKPARGSDALDDHQLLASIDSGFRSMDDSGGERHQAGAAEGSSGGKAAGDAGEPKARSRWEGDSDDEADAGADDAQAPSGAAAASLTAGALPESRAHASGGREDCCALCMVPSNALRIVCTSRHSDGGCSTNLALGSLQCCKEDV